MSKLFLVDDSFKSDWANTSETLSCFGDHCYTPILNIKLPRDLLESFYPVILGSNPDCIPPVLSRDERVRSSPQQQQSHRWVVLQFGIHEGGGLHVVQHVDIHLPLVSNDDADQTDISQVNCSTKGRRPHQFGDVAQVTEHLGGGIRDDMRHLILYKYTQNPEQAIT